MSRAKLYDIVTCLLAVVFVTVALSPGWLLALSPMP
jgi:hypothetical protein